MQAIGYYILEYIRKETALMETSASIHNISSDTIETIFGLYKDRKLPNKLFGVTSFILPIPLHTKLINLQSADFFDVKSRMERTKVRDVKEWANKNLQQSLVAKRTQKLAY